MPQANPETLVIEVYYADDWMCEIPGVAGDLSEVAAQLANGRKSLGDDGWWVAPQTIPSDHAASLVRYHYVAVHFVDGAYQIPGDLPGHIHAVAYGKGMGWDPEMMVFDVEGAREILAEIGDCETEYLVCREPHVPGVLQLRDGPIATFQAAH